ncbi:HAD-IIA family hydrolase [Halostreptopolyspora alba]|uniref:HAD-IIA family hydrolase n=1 Tax=Halostreptopolyspora alba TaxID=2487137 RepID=A0A3N0EBI4_9ACTN|nr:HAD-IIA family hydrolase [Nocardiopsaceae bacterium YIM 96095]
MTLLSSTRPLSSRHDAAFLDLDGVVYIGSHAIPAAPEAIEKARAAGMRRVFVTNNAARTPAAVADRLRALDVVADAGSVVTSAEAAARLVASRVPEGAPVLVVGDTGLRHAVRQWRLRPVSLASERPAAVVQGYSPRMGHDLMAEGALAVSRGSLFVVSNNDTTTPMDRGIIPANGSYARVIANATGQEPIVAGKPMRPLHDESVRRTGAWAPLVVGDRLDTDIEGANTHGAASMLVLSGVTTPAELLAAPPGQRPNFLAWDISGINLPHPRPRLDSAGEAHCGGWTVTTHAGRLRLAGEGDRIDGLRALCAAAWSSSRDTATDLSAHDALAYLGW